MDARQKCLTSLDSHLKHFKEQKVGIIWILSLVRELKKIFQKNFEPG